ncbi:chemotaxis-specific protein-glutamate methyltransferase CheB [Qipengyuania sp.]|uniref:chemotaxis-specific protein-glutamate methyltransferase CheB n=1 Tax=Qipengyuania sp. TaxID=2004515 RepID=UPI0035C87441
MAAVLTDRVFPGADKLSANTSADADVRVMIIDDSLTVRTVFKRMIDSENDLVVVAQAGTAEQALMTLRSTRIDVILLDLEMPGMGGLEALPRILGTAAGAQILVVSSLTADGAEATLRALQMGAADTMLKPRPGGFTEDYRNGLLGKIRALGGKPTIDDSPSPAIIARSRIPKRPHVVAIGASTGGIHAINLFLREIPAHFDLPILITQHLPESFIPVFARQIEAASGREAMLADEGVIIARGKVFIAPGHGHMVLRKSGDRVIAGLAHHPVQSGCRPSVDPMFESLAEAYEGHVAGVLLSGMGRDGSEGAAKIADAGGGIYAQDEATCAVWGMPRAVAEGGIAIAVCPPEELARKVLASAGADAWR